MLFADDDFPVGFVPGSWWTNVVPQHAVYRVGRHAWRRCAECGTPFPWKGRGQLFCRHACGQRARQRAKPEQERAYRLRYRAKASARKLAVKRQQRYRARKKASRR